MIQSAPFYWLTCDAEGCEAKSTEGSDSAAWADVEQAIEDAQYGFWTTTDDGKHFCWDHSAVDDEDDVVAEAQS